MSIAREFYLLSNKWSDWLFISQQDQLHYCGLTNKLETKISSHVKLNLGDVLLCRIDRYDPISKGYFLQAPPGIKEKIFLPHYKFLNHLNQGWSLVQVTREVFEDKAISVSDQIILQSQAEKIVFTVGLSNISSPCKIINQDRSNNLFLLKQATAICQQVKILIRDKVKKSQLMIHEHQLINQLRKYKIEQLNYSGELDVEISNYCRELGIVTYSLELNGAITRLQNILPQLQQALQATIELPGGGSIIIETGKTLTAIDVNSKGCPVHNFSSLAVNQQAVNLLIKQIQLRQLGGIFVVDFLRMNHHQQYQLNLFFHQQVTGLSEFNLPTPAVVGKFNNISKLGLYEFNCKKTSQILISKLEQLTQSIIKSTSDFILQGSIDNSQSKLLILYLQLLTWKILFHPKSTINKIIIADQLTDLIKLFIADNFPQLKYISNRISKHNSDLELILFE